MWAEGGTRSGGAAGVESAAPKRGGPLSNLELPCCFWVARFVPVAFYTRQVRVGTCFPTVNSVSLDPEARKVEHHYPSSSQVEISLRKGGREILVDETRDCHGWFNSQPTVHPRREWNFHSQSEA